MKEKRIIPSFKSMDEYTFDGYSVFVVQLDRQTKDFKHIINKSIKIDGKMYKGLGVSTYAIAKPYNIGLPVCIKVEKY